MARPGLIAAICLNMIIIGLWHGLTLNFLVFGLVQAVFLSVTVLILARAHAASAPPERAGAKPASARARDGLWRSSA